MAVGCPVTYNNGSCISPSYPSAGEGSLNDGLCGGWHYKDGRWPGFLTDLDITLDLGTVRDISSVGCTFMQATLHGVRYPSSVEVYYSPDGEEFTLAGVQEREGPEPVSGLDFEVFGTRCEGRARFIRYVARNPGGFLFPDEIIVR